MAVSFSISEQNVILDVFKEEVERWKNISGDDDVLMCMEGIIKTCQHNIEVDYGFYKALKGVEKHKATG